MGSALLTKADEFLDSLDALSTKNAVMTTLLAHEFTRQLYPNDPHLGFEPYTSHRKRIDLVLDGLMVLARHALRNLPAYPELKLSASQLEGTAMRDATGELYAGLWAQYNNQDLQTEGQVLLRRRLEGTGVDPKVVFSGKGLDAGCGSGRFTLGLKALGASSVTGLDWSEDGFRAAQNQAKSSRIEVDFIQGNLLDMPFPDRSFDFVFSNGTAHHTGNTEKAIEEVFRVAKQGAWIWLYIYGDGGLFWHARKRLPEIMANVGKDRAAQILSQIGLPRSRFIFMDNWFVPHEDHTSRKTLEGWLSALEVSSFSRVTSSIGTDLNPENPEDEELWGDGDLRYLIKK